MKSSMYVPMNKLIMDKETSWTFTHIDIPYQAISSNGIVMWCVDNIEARWTMLGGNKFGFEDAGDATMFKLQFGSIVKS